MLNTGLVGRWLDVNRETIELIGEFWIDVTRLRELVAETHRHDHPAKEVCPACDPLLTEATTLFTDDFLASSPCVNSASWKWPRAGMSKSSRPWGMWPISGVIIFRPVTCSTACLSMRPPSHSNLRLGYKIGRLRQGKLSNGVRENIKKGGGASPYDANLVD